MLRVKLPSNGTLTVRILFMIYRIVIAPTDYSLSTKLEGHALKESVCAMRVTQEHRIG